MNTRKRKRSGLLGVDANPTAGKDVGLADRSLLRRVHSSIKVYEDSMMVDNEHERLPSPKKRRITLPSSKESDSQRVSVVKSPPAWIAPSLKRKTDVPPSLKDRAVFDKLNAKKSPSSSNHVPRLSRAMLVSSVLKDAPSIRDFLEDGSPLIPRVAAQEKTKRNSQRILRSPFRSKEEMISQAQPQAINGIAKNPSEGKLARPSLALKENQKRPSQAYGRNNRKRSSSYKPGLIAKPRDVKLTREKSFLEELLMSAFGTPPGQLQRSFRSPSVLKSSDGLPPAPIPHVQFHTDTPMRETDQLIVDVSDVATTPKLTPVTNPELGAEYHMMDLDPGPEAPVQLLSSDVSATEIPSENVSWCRDTGYDPLQKNEQSSSDPFDLFHPRYKMQTPKHKVSARREGITNKSWRGVPAESYGAVRRNHRVYGKKKAKTVQFAGEDSRNADTDDLSDDELLLR